MMCRLNRAGISALLLLFLTTSASIARAAADPFPGVAAAYLLRSNGTTLWSHNSTKRLPPASLTKMMTLLIVVERGNLQRSVTVSGSAAVATGTALGLKRGDRLKAADLVAATLLGSANDACMALAEDVGGSEAGFVRLMNERARQLGMNYTHFVNPCGFHDTDHYSTAEDMAVLAEAVMRIPVIASLAGRIEGRIATIDGRRTFRFENKNELVGRYRGAIGVKTGFTSNAGPCLAAIAERNGVRVLLVLLNAPDRWWQAVALLDRAFSETRPSVAGAGP